MGYLYPRRMPIEITLSLRTCTNATTRKLLFGFSLYFMLENFKEISRTFSFATPKEVSYNRVIIPLMPMMILTSIHTNHMGSQKCTSDYTYSLVTCKHLSKRDTKACMQEQNTRTSASTVL